MINFAENLNKMITAGLGGETEAPRTEVAVGHRLQYIDASGPVASFETNIIAPVKNLLVNMLPIQAGSGDPSPDNIRPISGFDSVSVTRTGINIWDEVWELGSISNTTGTNTNATDRIRSVNYVAVKPGTMYYVSGPHTVGVRFYDSDKNYLTYSTKLNSSFITQENCYYIRFIILATTEYDYDTSINYPASDHDYHSGNVQTVSITLGDTVYGGTLDVTTGKLTVDRERILIKDISWAYQENYTRFFSSALQNRILAPASQTVAGEIISELYKTSAYSIYTDLNIAVGTSGAIFIKDSRFTDTQNFLASVGDYSLVYKLAEPVEIDLDPQQITTLIGDNNIWSDAGDVDVTYTYYEETEGY